ncbi:hypothetical protein OROHE_023002 [Orobanche hederae]
MGSWGMDSTYHPRGKREYANQKTPKKPPLQNPCIIPGCHTPSLSSRFSAVHTRGFPGKIVGLHKTQVPMDVASASASVKRTVAVIFSRHDPRYVSSRGRENTLREYVEAFRPFVITFWNDAVPDDTYSILDCVKNQHVIAALNFNVTRYHEPDIVDHQQLQKLIEEAQHHRQDFVAMEQ